MDPRETSLSWIEIDAEAFRHNLSVFRRRLPSGSRLLLVVKANAYGHGLAPITQLASREAVDQLGVHSIEEAATVRAEGWRGPVLLMGPLHHLRVDALLDLQLEPTITELHVLDHLESAAVRRGITVPCHLKLETGTHRQGVMEEDVPSFLDRFRTARAVRLHGLSTHFANIEDTTDHRYAEEQLSRFRSLVASIESSGFSGLTLHTACTAALLTLPATCFDLVRLGIGAYGLWPSRETLASTRTGSGEAVQLRPVLTWKCRIGSLKWTPAGAYVGYGCSYRAVRRTRLAILPIGYADGYDRALSDLAHVILRGQRAPVLGRICMNITLVDASDAPEVALEDPVTLLGREGSERVDAERLAAWADTIPYEVVSRLSPGLPRIVVDGEGRLLPD